MASPNEDELVAAVTVVRDAHPDLGILKLWAQLKTDKPEWAVSEKRFRKALASAGGTASGAGANAPSAKKSTSKGGKTGTKDGAELVADTGLDATLDIDKLAPKVKAKLFGGTKGKGLVARVKLQMGEVVWQEEPWIACPDPTLKQHLVAQVLCTHCLAQWDRPAPPLSVDCSSCTTAHFCNRLCASRARTTASHHDLLCEGVNPAARALNKLVEAREWRSLDVVARILARWRGERAWGAPGADKEIEKRVWDGMARVNMETRESEKADWATRKDFTERQWVLGHQAILEALNPTDDASAKKFAQVLASKAPRNRKPTPLSDEEEARWFSYESFLMLLGMVNINQEDSGGLYALHAHLNHSCEPNIQVRNLPKSFVPPTPNQLPTELPGRSPVRGTHKLTMLARETIQPGTELTISYVNTALPRNVRRQALRDGYGFWCECVRCERERREEEKAAKAEAAKLEADKVARVAEAAKEAEKTKEKETKEAKGDKSEKQADAITAKMEELGVVDDML